MHRRFFIVMMLAAALCTACARDDKPQGVDGYTQEDSGPETEAVQDNAAAEDIPDGTQDIQAPEDVQEKEEGSWFLSYDWENCPEKDLSSITLYGKYVFPFDPYDFIEENFSEITLADEEYFPDSEKDGDPVTVTPADIRRKDIYGPGRVSGRTSQDGIFISFESNRQKAEDHENALSTGEMFLDGYWEADFSDFPHEALGIDVSDCRSDRERLSKVVDALGRPSFLIADSADVNDAEGITKDYFRQKQEFYLVWKMADDHYFSILVADGPESWAFEYNDFCMAGGMNYLNAKTKPYIGSQDMYAVLDFEEALKVIQ